MESGAEPTEDISAVIPVSERPDDLREIYRQYSEQLSATGKSYEFVFVLDGPAPPTNGKIDVVGRSLICYVAPDEL